jgi:predicted  nucleic acid-binding Zn-ribbon protein
MSDHSNSPLLETEELLRELLREVRKMKSDISSLRQENDRLRKELAANDSKPAGDLFGNGSAEKIALRQQIMVLIEKIDKHLTGDIR